MIDVKWDPRETRAKWVKEASKWMDFRVFGSLRPGTGVFVFAEDDETVEYVGISPSEEHPVKSISLALAHGKGGTASSVLFLYTESDRSSSDFFKFLVDKYNPPYNNCLPKMKEIEDRRIG